MSARLGRILRVAYPVQGEIRSIEFGDIGIRDVVFKAVLGFVLKAVAKSDLT